MKGLGTLNHTLEDVVVQEKFQLDNQCLEVRKKLSEHPSTQQLLYKGEL